MKQLSRVAMLILLAGLVAGTLWATKAHIGGRTLLNQTRPLKQSISIYDNEHQQQVDLTSLINGLSDKDLDVRESNRKRIVGLAHQSAENRQTVIAELARRVQASDFRDQLTTLQGSFFWVQTCKIFEELKSLETIDLLVDCIDCPALSERVGNAYHHRPAIDALVVMGQPAVPKISRILAHPDSNVRVYAAVCLGSIQGAKAREALVEALRNEQDEYVRKEMQNAIEAIDRG